MPDLFIQLRGDAEDEGFTPPPLADDEALALLLESEFADSKLIPWGSNYSFAVALVTAEGADHLAVYKPLSGEAPLYDFPEGTLYLREVASYHLSRTLGWDMVPPTVIRDGPHGIGSLQIYVQPMAESEEWDPRSYWSGCGEEIERLVLFDHIANNADRKIGHCLRDERGKVWGIDHGLTFNENPKMRTVLWQFVGMPISPRLREDLLRVHADESAFRELMRPYLSRAEVNALLLRIDRIAQSEMYPALNPRRNIPYGWW